MSHSTCLVILPPGMPFSEGELSRRLAPFNESKSVNPYVEYTKEQLIAKGRESIEDYRNGTYAEYLADPEAYIAKYSPIGEKAGHIKYLTVEFPKKLQWTDEEVYQDEIGVYDSDDIGVNGEVYSTYNPDSKWDWYSIGGRWSNSLLLKSGEKANMAQIKDIDFDTLAANETARAQKCWENAQKESEDVIRYFQYGIGKDETMEQYIQKKSAFAFFSALTPDGKWHERGKMGWWAVVVGENEDDITWAAKFKERFIDTADPESVVVVVDVHI